MGGGSSVVKTSPAGNSIAVNGTKPCQNVSATCANDRNSTHSQSNLSPKQALEKHEDCQVLSSENNISLRRSPANANGLFSDEDRNELDYSPRSEASTGAAELFSHTAMSLGMDNDDLLFNLLYFGDGGGTNFGVALNNAQQETIALYSENNTPYKLKPASSSSIAGLIGDVYSDETGVETECSVCKEEFEPNIEILRIPTCKHYFHHDCLIRWINLQGWCPVCRAKIEPEAEKNSSHEKKEDCDHDVASISGSCKHYTHNGTPIACLAGQFDAAGHTETDDD